MVLMMDKEILKNSLTQRCDSCGDSNSCKKYNQVYLCIGCLRMDKRGTSRDNWGQIIPSSKQEIIISKPKEYNERLRKTRKSSR